MALPPPSLPTPNLDDRRFQELVDEAKRYVQQQAPEWTDHNVSDPGVTLIETFAHMVEQLLYRLNRVPEKNYLAFLDLLGVRLFPPAAATAEVVFWLSTAQPDLVLLPHGTEVATSSAGAGEPVVFGTIADLHLVPCALEKLVTVPAGGEQTDRTTELAAGRDVRCFAERPAQDDTVLFGLSTAVPRCVVAVRLDSRVEGIGVDPRQPPLVWEAWDGSGWAECEVYADGTGGLNRPGEVLVRMPATHQLSTAGGSRAGWLRCRVVAAEAGQPFYAESPTIREAAVDTVGGVMTAEHAETLTDTPLGVADGVPGQRFRLPRGPVLTENSPMVVQVADADPAAADYAARRDPTDPGGWQDWQVVEHFGRSGPGDRHVTLDAVTGEVCFPPAVREADGTLRRFGALPPAGAQVRMPRYRTGGGRRGNVARGTIATLRSSVPYVARVENREAASGGVDGEQLGEAVLRAPHQLRISERAITAADHEYLARQAAPAAARVHCLPGGTGEAGDARVLVVPDAVPDAGDRLRFEQLIPSAGMLGAVAGALEKRRLIGSRIAVEPPFYQGVTVVAQVLADTGAGGADGSTEGIGMAAADALYRYLNPLRGGPDGDGWPFGRPVQYGEVFAVLQRVPGVRVVQTLRLYPADPITGRRGTAAERIDLDENALVFSHQHQVQAITVGTGSDGDGS